MKKFLSLLILAGVLCIGVFAGGNYVSGVGLDATTLELLQRRSETWNMVCDSASKEAMFVEELHKYVYGTLYSEDLSWFQELRVNPTEMEPVEIIGFDAESIKKMGRSAELVGVQSAIIRNADGTAEMSKIREKVNLIEFQGNWYLESLEVLD